MRPTHQVYPMSMWLLHLLSAVTLLRLLIACQVAPPNPIESHAVQDPNHRKSNLVVFVHGYTGGRETWGKFPELIRSDEALRDFDTYVMEYPTHLFPGWKNPSIRQVGEFLATEIHERFSGYREIYLVGHSMGGLVIQSMVVEQLKAGRAPSLKSIKHIILFGTPNNGKDIPRLVRLFDSQLEGLAATEETVDEIRNELINRVYTPTISPGDRNSKLHIPITVVIGLQDEVVEMRSAESFFRNPPPVTVPGNHRTMKEPPDSESAAFLVVKNRALGTASPQVNSPTVDESGRADPVIDLAIGEPFGNRTLIMLANSGVQAVVEAAVNLRCLSVREKDDPHSFLYFEGFPALGNHHSWWTIDKIEPGDRITRDSKESLIRCLHNKHVAEGNPRLNHKTVETILAVDIEYRHPVNRRRYEWSSIAQLFEDTATGEPFLHPIPLSESYRTMLENNPAPNYRQGSQ